MNTERREYTFILERKIEGRWQWVKYPNADNLYVLVRSSHLELLGYLNTACKADWRWIRED